MRVCFINLRYMEIFCSGKKVANLANHEPFTKIYFANIHRYTVMYMAYALTVVDLPNFSLPIAFTCMVRQMFPLSNTFRVQYPSIQTFNRMVSAFYSIQF